jgi:phosphohistidine phosphatase SixA
MRGERCQRPEAIRRRRWIRAAIVALGLQSLGSLVFGGSPAAATTVVLVRHAEKGDGENPGLTAEGAARAEALAEVVAEAGVVAVYATEWCRTALTAEPAAARLGLELRIQDNGRPGDQLAGCGLARPTARLDAAISTVEALASHVLAAHPDGAVLIVGHSDTVPALVAALGAPLLCPEYFTEDDGGCHIPDQEPRSEYHHLFVVEVPAAAAPRLLKAEYGD